MKHPAVIDVWAQRPGSRFLEQPWLATLNRWTGGNATREVPVNRLLADMDAANVSQVFGL